MARSIETVLTDLLNYKKADTCIECGFCEHVCPSRYVTLTPRQRLQARRVINRTGSPELEKEYHYIGEQTCAADGMCQVPCPMGISTAVVTDAIRAKKATKAESGLLHSGAEHYGAVETDLRAMLKLTVGTERVISPYPLIWATDFLHRLSHQMPHWSAHFPMPRKLHYREVENPDYVTDYYMIVQSPNGGINLYSETDPQSNVLNDKLIVNGTALHIQGEKTGTDQKDWGYTQYHGMNGYVPMDDLDPASREEAANEEYRTFGGKDVDFEVKVHGNDENVSVYNGPGEKFDEVSGADGIADGTSVHISQYMRGEDGTNWGKTDTDGVTQGWLNLDRDTDYVNENVSGDLIWRLHLAANKYLSNQK